MRNVVFFITMIGVYFSTAVYAKEVSYTDVAARNNAIISIMVKQGLSAKDLSTRVNNGVLQVVGFVDNHAEYVKLAEILMKYQEHKKVLNNVKILKAKEQHKDEEKLKHNIQEQLKQRAFPADDIVVHVRGNHVIIGGFISRYIEAEKVGNAVRAVPGAQIVDNYVLYKSKS